MSYSTKINPLSDFLVCYLVPYYIFSNSLSRHYPGNVKTALRDLPPSQYRSPLLLSYCLPQEFPGCLTWRKASFDVYSPHWSRRLPSSLAGSFIKLPHAPVLSRLSSPPNTYIRAMHTCKEAVEQKG